MANRAFVEKVLSKNDMDRLKKVLSDKEIEGIIDRALDIGNALPFKDYLGDVDEHEMNYILNNEIINTLWDKEAELKDKITDVINKSEGLDSSNANDSLLLSNLDDEYLGLDNVLNDCRETATYFIDSEKERIFATQEEKEL